MPRGLVEELIAHNHQQSRLFCEPGATLGRRNYRRDHATEIICLKCMDGRVNMPLLTGTPMGIMHPVRNIGGAFELGWPAFQHRIRQVVDYSMENRLLNLVLATYHFARGDKHRGCRGHGYDTKKAVASARNLVLQFEEVYGDGREQVDPILVGIETDEEALVFHDRCGERSISMAEYGGADEASMRKVIKELYPNMREKVAEDLLPLMLGNARHVKELRMRPRPPVQLEHTERILAVGQGFDWLHKPNYALIINDFDPQMDDAIAAAAKIIAENRDAGRIPSSGALILASVAYGDIGPSKSLAVVRARYLTRLARETLVKHHPKLTRFFHSLTTVVDWNTRQLEIVEAP